MSELRFMTSAELSGALAALERSTTVDAWLQQLDKTLPHHEAQYPAVSPFLRDAALRNAAERLHLAGNAFLEAARGAPEAALYESAESFLGSVQTIHTRRVENLHHCVEMLGRCGLMLQVRSQDRVIDTLAKQIYGSIETWQRLPKAVCSTTARAQAAQHIWRVTQRLHGLAYTVRAAVASVSGGACLTAIVILRTSDDDASPLSTMVVPRTMSAPARKQPAVATLDQHRPAA